MRAALLLQIMLILKVDGFFLPPPMRLGPRHLNAAEMVQGMAAVSSGTTLPVCDSCEKTIENVVNEKNSPVCHTCGCEKENLCSVNPVAGHRSTQQLGISSALVQSINGMDDFLKALASNEERPVIIHYVDRCCRAVAVRKHIDI